MSRTNHIVVNDIRFGKTHNVEGIIAAADTPKPGQIVQIDPTVALDGGKHTWKLYDRGADGDQPAGPHIILVEDAWQGKTITDAYAAGDRAFGFVPLSGDEVNLLYKNETGTADDVVAGDLFMVDDGSGKVTLTSGTPEVEVAMALEALTDPTADALVWSVWGLG